MVTTLLRRDTEQLHLAVPKELMRKALREEVVDDAALAPNVKHAGCADLPQSIGRLVVGHAKH